MKRIITHPGKIIPVFAALIALAVGTVWAGPHFLRGSASLDSTEGYCVSFKEAGLGSTPVT
jgi:hypothetical protein